MMHYKKGKNVEQELSQEQIPIEVLPERFLWMHVKGGSSVKNLTEHAKQALTDGSYRSVVWSGSDGGVGKTISCAEILKRDFELHQVTRICYRKVEEFWDPLQEGLEQIVAKRNIPCVHILESLDAIDAGTPGYQHSKSQAGFWVEAVGFEGATKRPQGQRRPRDGEKKGNYFTGPQLKKKANRHYGNGRQDDEAGAANGSQQQQRRDRSVDKGKSKPPSGNTPGDGSRKKGKPKDDNRNNPKNGSHEAAATSTGQPKD